MKSLIYSFCAFITFVTVSSYGQTSIKNPIIVDAKELTATVGNGGGGGMPYLITCYESYVIFLYHNNELVYVFNKFLNGGCDEYEAKEELNHVNKIIERARRENKNIQIGGVTFNTLFAQTNLTFHVPIKAVSK